MAKPGSSSRAGSRCSFRYVLTRIDRKSIDTFLYTPSMFWLHQRLAKEVQRQGIFLFTKELILEADWEELRKEGTKPIVEVMARTLRFFGPLPKGLLDTIDDDNWRIILTTIESTFSEDNPRYPFLDWEDWTNLDDGTKAFLAGPLNLDPAKRPTVEEFLEHGWWRE